MSDLMVGGNTLEATPDGQSQRASDAQPQGQSDGQPSPEQVVKVEDFKNLQRKLSEKDLQSKQALAEAQQARAFAQQLQQQLRQLEDNAAPDDYTRLELQLKRAKEEAAQYAQAYQQTLQERQAETARMNALREIADEFELPLEEFREAVNKANADDYAKAAKVAARLQVERERRKQQLDDDKSRRNMPDIGSGAPRTASSDWDRQYQDAVSRRDSAEQMRLLRIRGRT